MKLGRTWLNIALLACGLVALAACAPKTSGQTPPVPGDQSVATVDGRAVWASDVRVEAVAEGLIAQGETLDVNSPQFRQTLDEVIDQRLLSAEAVRRNLDHDPQVQRRLAAARDRVLAGVLTDQLVAGAVAPEQIQKMYDETSVAAQRSEEVRLSQIVVPTALQAVAIKNALDKGQKFEALAQLSSIDPQTRFKGGDLGSYLALNALPPEYASALIASDARIGDLVGPFQISAGWVLLKVVDRRQEAPISLEEARPLIVRFLTYDQVKDLLENLRGKARLQITLPSDQSAAPAAPPTPAPAISASIQPSRAAVNPTPSSVKPGASSLPAKPAAK